MLNYTFEDYHNKNKKYSKQELWNSYKSNVIHKGGYSNIFSRFKKIHRNDYSNEIELWNRFNQSNLFKLYGGQNISSTLCHSEIVFINENKESIDDFNKKEPLQVGLLISTTKKNGTIIFFNVIYNFKKHQIIPLDEQLETNIIELPRNEIFIIENKEVKIHKTIKEWISNNEMTIFRKLEKECNNPKLKDCIVQLGESFLDNQISLCKSKVKKPLIEIKVPTLKPSKPCSSKVKPVQKGPPESLYKRSIPIGKSSTLTVTPPENKFFKLRDGSSLVTDTDTDSSVSSNVSEDLIPLEYISNFNYTNLYKVPYPKPESFSSIKWASKEEYNPPYFTLTTVPKGEIKYENNPVYHNCITDDIKEKHQLNTWGDPLDISLIPFTKQDIQKSFPWVNSSCRLNPLLDTPLQDRKSLYGKLKFKNKYPLNPLGKTGVAGRGCLPRWGGNMTIGIIYIYKDFKTNKWYVINGRHDSPPLQLILNKEVDDNNKINIIKDIFVQFFNHIDEDTLQMHVSKLNNISNFKQKDFSYPFIQNKWSKSRSLLYYQKLLSIINYAFDDKTFIIPFFEGLLRDSKNTDNAWIESRQFVLNFEYKPKHILNDEWEVLLKLLLISLSQDPDITIQSLEDLDMSLSINKRIQHIISNVSDKTNKHTKSKLDKDYFKTLENIEKVSNEIYKKRKTVRKDFKHLKSDTRSYIKDDNELKKLNNVQNIINCDKKYFKNKSICQPITDDMLRRAKNARWISKNTYDNLT